jgi:Flp pilus assembly protein TadB
MKHLIVLSALAAFATCTVLYHHWIAAAVLSLAIVGYASLYVYFGTYKQIKRERTKHRSTSAYSHTYTDKKR